MKTTLLSRIRQRNRITVIALSISAFSYFPQQASAQGVGINTTTPDPSAALDIQSTNKGILIPQVQLQSSVDNVTIPSPANGLLVYNKNNSVLSGTGFYQNTGTKVVPNWEILSRLKLPYSQGTSAVTAFNIQNYSGNSATVAIKGYSSGVGTGIFAESDNGYALQVKGFLKIFGTGQAPGAGKVLTSNDNGEATWQGAVAFSAVGVKGNGGEIVAKNDEYKIPFNAETYDLSDNYKNFNQNPASTFVAPVNGIYHFDAYITFSSIVVDVDDFPPVTTTTSLKLKSNGVVSSILSDQKYTFPVNSSQLSADVRLSAGDEVFVTFSHFTLSHMKLFNGHFNGRLVISQ